MLVARPAAARTRLSDILAGPVSTSASCRSRLTGCDGARQKEPPAERPSRHPCFAAAIQEDGLDRRCRRGGSSSAPTNWIPLTLPYLTKAYAELGQFVDARRCISDSLMAIETTKQLWWQAEVYRMAGEIALKSPPPDAAKAEEYFERALSVARQQQAKSRELRAAMSLARLWRDQGKVSEARELLAPVYGWFTEGFDTRDLKDAKALLEELA